MRPEFKTFQFKLDDADDKGIIRGFASTFGNVDLGDDVVDQGAFKKTIKDNKGIFPILADHDPTKHIGWNLRAEETKDGLFVEGQIDMNTQMGREKYSLAKKAVEIGAKMGMSIGYGTVKAEPDKERPKVRRLKELKLYEYSIVTFPMNTSAQITAAKAAQMASPEAFIEYCIEQAKAFGFDQAALQKALRGNGAADKSYDSDQVIQSLDQIINSMKHGG